MVDAASYVVHVRKLRFDVYIGRPSKWGNPYSHMYGTSARYKARTRAEAIVLYEGWILDQPGLLEAARRELRSKILGCWCSPLPCHGHVLARLVNLEPRNVRAEDAYRAAWQGYLLCATDEQKRVYEKVMDGEQSQIAQGPSDPRWREFTATLPGFDEFWGRLGSFRRAR